MVMKRIWIKLYIEILDDPKMGRIPDWLWKRAVELFLLAGENGNDGLLQPVEDMAWRLRTSAEKLTESLQALSQVGVVHETPEGWTVTNFEKRQYSESYERVKRFRNAKSNAKSNADGNANVLSTSSSNSSSDSLAVEGEGVGEGEIFKAYESNIGMLTPKIADGLKADIDDYSPMWVMTAIEYAVKQEKRSLAYVEGTLKGWKRDGLSKPPVNGNGSKSQAIPQGVAVAQKWLEKKQQEQPHGKHS
ncbi:MAG: DnaD domain protein [Casimicrobiaceae bacterium]